MGTPPPPMVTAAPRTIAVTIGSSEGVAEDDERRPESDESVSESSHRRRANSWARAELEFRRSKRFDVGSIDFYVAPNDDDVGRPRLASASPSFDGACPNIGR